MIGKLFKGLVEGAATPVANVMMKKEETKQQEAELAHQLNIQPHQLNMLRTQKAEKTWRDEYVTVWVTLGVSVLGYFAFLEAGVDGVIAFLTIPVVQWSIIAVVVAALGVKGLNQIGGRK